MSRGSTWAILNFKFSNFQNFSNFQIFNFFQIFIFKFSNSLWFPAFVWLSDIFLHQWFFLTKLYGQQHPFLFLSVSRAGSQLKKLFSSSKITFWRISPRLELWDFLAQVQHHGLPGRELFHHWTSVRLLQVNSEPANEVVLLTSLPRIQLLLQHERDTSVVKHRLDLLVIGILNTLILTKTIWCKDFFQRLKCPPWR